MSSGDRLKEALEANQQSFRDGLKEAERELAELRERERVLQGLIARARAALGETDAPPSSGLTLHEAIAVVLRDNRNEWMNVRQLADQVNRRGLYRKRDGTPVEPNQIHARTKNYGSQFEKRGPEVRLRQP